MAPERSATREPVLSHLPFSMTRLTVLGILLLAPGLYYCLRFGSGFLRMLTRKFRRGKPYLKGSASDYFLFSFGFFLMALLGAVFLTASGLQSAFQGTPAPREVGTVKAETLQPGRMRLTFAMKTDYPEPRESSTDVAGVRWSLEGQSLKWRFCPRRLGFRPGHRIEAALGSSHASGAPDRPQDFRGRVSGISGLAFLAKRHPLWFPLAKIELLRTPWMPAEGRTYRIFAGSAGYVLLEEPEQKGSGS